MQGFSQYLAEAQGMGVPFLYPLGYQGVGQYPPEYLAALFPDALIYIAADERLQKCWEEEPFKIDHLKPQPIFNKAYGKLSLVSTHPKLPPGKSIPWKSIKPDPDEKLYPSGPAHPCMVSEPKCLPGHISSIDAEKFGDPCYGLWKMPENNNGGLKMKSFLQFVDLLEAKKWAKSNSEKYKRIECEECKDVYYVPIGEYEKRLKRSSKGDYIQFPDEDCPNCRHTIDKLGDTGFRRKRYGDHTGFAEGKHKEYANLGDALPGQVPVGSSAPSGPVSREPLIPDEFAGPLVVEKKRRKGKRMKLE